MKPLWQTTEWEAFQKALGHSTIRIGEGESSALMIIHPLFFGYSYGYIPRGPCSELAEFGILLSELEQPSKKKNLVFTRIDPEVPICTPRANGLVESSSVQPETTLIIDLTLSEEKILEHMKRKGRYNIALARKKGVVVKRAIHDSERKSFCHDFHRILTETTQRDAFAAHPEQYYQTLLQKVESSEIFLAYYDGMPIAGAICTFQKERAIYYYGASSNHHRDLMAPYLVQWEAIREAKSRGCLSYDFLGIAPEEALADHPWKGITDFKKKFGGTVVHYPKPIDIIHRPFWYSVYKFLKFLQKTIQRSRG